MAILPALGICACASSPDWIKDGASQQDHATATYECDRDIGQRNFFAIGGGLVGWARTAEIKRRCMTAKGGETLSPRHEPRHARRPNEIARPRRHRPRRRLLRLGEAIAPVADSLEQAFTTETADDIRDDGVRPVVQLRPQLLDPEAATCGNRGEDSIGDGHGRRRTVGQRAGEPQGSKT